MGSQRMDLLHHTPDIFLRRPHAQASLARFRRIQSPKRVTQEIEAGQIIGIREVADQVWLVSFMHYDLGFFDKDEDRVEPGPNPFAPEKVLTMSPE